MLPLRNYYCCFYQQMNEFKLKAHLNLFNLSPQSLIGQQLSCSPFLASEYKTLLRHRCPLRQCSLELYPVRTVSLKKELRACAIFCNWCVCVRGSSVAAEFQCFCSFKKLHQWWIKTYFAVEALIKYHFKCEGHSPLLLTMILLHFLISLITYTVYNTADQLVFNF